MIIGSFYSFFRDMIVQYYYQVQSWFYVSVEVQEGDDCYKWLSGKGNRELNTNCCSFNVLALGWARNKTGAATNLHFY
jgi:hypothetical protein